MSHTKHWFFVAFFLLAVNFILTTANRGLFEPDESRYALVAQGILEEGHWLVPYLEGQPYTHKPPLYLWLVALLRALGFSWTQAAVLPAFTAALILLLWLPRLAQSFGLTLAQGYTAATALVGSPFFATMALAARMDMLLVLALTVCWAAAFVLLTGEREQQKEYRSFYWLFWLALGLAVLSKGPVAVALIGGTMLLFRLTSPNQLPWRNIFAGVGWLVALGVVLAWYLPAALSQGKAWVLETLIRQSAGRMVSSFAHKEPIYFHLITWPFTGFPTSLLALGGALAFFRKDQSPDARFLAAGFLSVLGFFSFISGKLVIYLLPLVPFSVLLSLKALQKPQSWQHWLLGCSSGIGLALGAATITLPWWRPEIPLPPWASVLCGAGLVLSSCLGLVMVFRKQPGKSLVWLVVGGVWFSGVILPVVTNALAERLSVRMLAFRYKNVAPQSKTGYVYRDFFSGLPLYSEKKFERLFTPEDLAQVLNKGVPVVMKEKDALKLGPFLASRDVVVERFGYRRSALLLVYRKSATGTP